MPKMLPENYRKEWSTEDKDKLAFWWGVFSLPTLAKRLKRTPWGIATEARKMKLGPFSRGTIAMREFERLSGFSILKIKATVEALSIRLVRITVSDPAHGKKKRRFAITEEQQELLLEHMLANPLYFKNKPGSGRTTRGVWGIGKKPPACIGCSRTDKPHFAKGKCKYCYTRPYKEAARMREKLLDALKPGT